MKIDLKNLDKSGWQTYRFDEIAKNISQRIDPTSTDIEQYIGLEHLDKESLHIRRVGSKSEVKGQKLKCFPGDVIFGKRRAYQRKAAVVTEEAICSAHAFVLRANPDVIEPALFPFFLHSDQFMHRAVDISVGGLSPTINWGTLKSQEFLLPPKEQQAELAELLWAMDEVIEKELKLLERSVVLRRSKEKEAFNNEDFSPKIHALDYFDSVRDGTHDTPKKQSDGYKLLTSRNIINNKLSLESDYFITKEDYNAINKRSKVDKNDILFGMIGTVGQVCRVIDSPNYAIKNMGLFKVADEGKSLFAFYYFKSSFFQHNLKRKLSGTTQKYVSLGFLRSIKLPDHTKQKVRDWVATEILFDNLVVDVNNKVNPSKLLQKSLISQIF
ncbi:MAG: restriction endonuclease subunit S [Candidatus Electrothrix sp.]